MDRLLRDAESAKSEIADAHVLLAKSDAQRDERVLEGERKLRDLLSQLGEKDKECEVLQGRLREADQKCVELRRACDRENERLRSSEQAIEHMRIELQTVRCAFERTDEEL